MASSGPAAVPAERGIATRLLRLTFALSVALFFWSFVGGFAYLLGVQGTLPLRTDPLQGARQRAVRKDTAGAVKQYRLATWIDPADTRSANELGELFLRVGRHDEAYATFEQSLRVSPGDARAFSGSADVRLAQQRYPEAIALYERALETTRRPAPVLNDLGTAYARSGDFESAIQSFTASLAVTTDPMVQANLDRARADQADARSAAAKVR